MNLPLSTSEHPPQAPTSLNFYSGGYFGSSLWLEWDGSRLYRKRQDSGGSDPRIDSWVCLLPPSAETWSDFRRLLDELKAWRWRRNWINREIMDGWQWNLVLVWGTQKWSGSGSNASPGEFSRVERLLEALAKGRKAPGFPAGFSIRANQALGEVQFAWMVDALSGSVALMERLVWSRASGAASLQRLGRGLIAPSRRYGGLSLQKE